MPCSGCIALRKGVGRPTSREGSSALSARRPPAGACDPTSCSLKGAPIRARRRCPLACMRTYSPPLRALGSGTRRHATRRTAATPRPPVEQVTASPHPLAPAPPPIARLRHAPPQSRSPRPPALSRPPASARGATLPLRCTRMSVSSGQLAEWAPLPALHVGPPQVSSTGRAVRSKVRRSPPACAAHVLA